MIDREQLQTTFTQIRKTCLSMALSPAMLLFVAWMTYLETGSHSSGIGSGEMAPVWLIFCGALVLSPLVVVPLVRGAILRWAMASDRPDAEQRLQTLLPAETFAVLGAWEVAALSGFVSFFVGAPWWFYLAALGVAYVGLLANFPRWSVWSRRVDELERAGTTQSLPAPL